MMSEPKTEIDEKTQLQKVCHQLLILLYKKLGRKAPLPHYCCNPCSTTVTSAHLEQH